MTAGIKSFVGLNLSEDENLLNKLENISLSDIKNPRAKNKAQTDGKIGSEL
jgi:hypothetical protein